MPVGGDDERAGGDERAMSDGSGMGGDDRVGGGDDGDDHAEGTEGDDEIGGAGACVCGGGGACERVVVGLTLGGSALSGTPLPGIALGIALAGCTLPGAYISGGAPPASPGPSPMDARERRATRFASSDAAFASSRWRSSSSTSDAASAALRTHLMPSR